MKRALVLLLACAATLSCFSERAAVTEPVDESACNVPGSAIGSNRAVVLIRGFRFLPDTVRIRPGGTVTWVNCETQDIEPHTSTSSTGVWDSGPIPRGTSHAQTFGTAGTFAYFCRPHSSMRGTVLVN